MPLDLSVYLVTGRDLLPNGKDYFETLEESLKGGVTVVQIREKTADTAEFLHIATRSKEICDRYLVPLLINDRIDIALAVKAAGIHVGQSDMPVAIARQLLPPGSVIGVTCNTIQHIRQALIDKVDYVGIGPVFPTKTKPLADPAIGIRGVGSLLEALEGTTCQAVAIGGINNMNLLRTLHGTASVNNRQLDGVAIVSDIMASPEPEKVARGLSTTMKHFKNRPTMSNAFSENPIPDGITSLLDHIKKINPLVHHITNTVVINQSANIILALGGSPLMAPTPEEMEDLSKIPGALLINIGTLHTEGRLGMTQAGYFANLARKPIVLDPVGVGATRYRKDMVNELLNHWQPSVIKGNAGELAALGGSAEVESKGVDSVGPGFKDPVAFVRHLAKKEKCVIVLTGATDYISSASGDVVVSCTNGHPILGKITGSGCIVGSSIAAFCAVASDLAVQNEASLDPSNLAHGDMFLAAVTGVLMITVAAEKVMQNNDVGQGFFLNHLIDQISALTSSDIVSLARIQVVRFT